MIIYLHGFDATSPGNHEKVLQLQFIDPDVRLISYSTRHPRHDMQHLLKEVDKMQQLTDDDRPLICGVGLGGFWAERIGFLCGMRQVIFNPNLFPEENMPGKIDRPEEYVDIATNAWRTSAKKTATAVWCYCRGRMMRWMSIAAPGCLLPSMKSFGMSRKAINLKTFLIIYSARKPLKRWDKRGQQMTPAIGTG
ncbi:hypothetical protein NVIRENTERO_00996 [Sodalis praecaptivus]|nr:hypothetical protein NVIRENTERO_00996 [Sodalis praecaptivus]